MNEIWEIWIPDENRWIDNQGQFQWGALIDKQQTVYARDVNDKSSMLIYNTEHGEWQTTTENPQTFYRQLCFFGYEL